MGFKVSKPTTVKVKCQRPPVVSTEVTPEMRAAMMKMAGENGLALAALARQMFQHCLAEAK